MSDAPVRDVLLLGETPKGKHIEFVRQGRIARLQFREGGQLPECLIGGWTDVKNAQSAVNGYLHSLKEGKATENCSQTGKAPARRRKSS